MANILEKIVDQTKEDNQKRKFKYSVSSFRSFEDYGKERRGFASHLKKENTVQIIAEIKKASPSKGLIRPDFNPEKHAQQYIEAGAAAISVLTDKPFFQGDLLYMQLVSRMSKIPVLRKDFIVDEFQIEEARAFGADAILLIASILEPSQIIDFIHYAKEIGLECLVECYDQTDFDKLDFNWVKVLGVNNRNLSNFEVNVHRGIKLLQQAPKNVITVSESGLSKPQDLELLATEGIHSALIGEHFMKQADPGSALKEILKF
ncbi:MAG: indole-3-glycerol phosphate synthase TrpC [Bacteroidetes bacterium]|nr:indole-3-glycerol phosphate synthase TrpC [Bacteroidota bacterium]NCQ11275.1 indole-3-glycerol phosphate synthase TrpC [Bacteroidota bacterium]